MGTRLLWCKDGGLLCCKDDWPSLEKKMGHLGCYGRFRDGDRAINGCWSVGDGGWGVVDLMSAHAMVTVVASAKVEGKVARNRVMDQWLIDVAREGKIDALYVLLHEDLFILEKVDQVPFIDTPLHIAVLAGKNIFAMEIANLKLSFAKKLNQDRLSPIHLASTMVDTRMVKELFTIGRELCLLKGREKRTPLHVAIIFGRIDVINELINEFPKSLEELTVHK
ncbi:hypothetical protein HHK36_000841 [Tetracentron sinense]|uniref:Uncharacterized protein n=1 Tax=Tetracentron sinense TaxID=13715 RepID=A0A834ZS92_TETSI|nr:hypothetical protein HHK36_000841 [Tetracentron sinense]